RAVVDARGVAGGDRTLGEQRAQPRQRLDRRARTWMLVDLEGAGFALTRAGHGDRDDLAGEEARGLRRRGALVAARGTGALVGARTAMFAGDVLAGLRHGLGAVQRLQARIDEAPAHGGVFHLLAAVECGLGLADHERRSGQRLDPAGDREREVAAADATRSLAHRLQP